MAAFIEDKIGAKSEVVEGARGEFTVWVGDERVAEKSEDGFPTEQQVLTAVQKALARK